MNFDRNTVIGFIALGLLMFGYFYFSSQEQKAFQSEKARQDSILLASKPKVDPLTQKKHPFQVDFGGKSNIAEGFRQPAGNEEQLVTVENDLMKIVFTNKGGQPRSVEIKNFKDQEGNTVKLSSSNYDKITYAINTADNKSVQIADLFFEKAEVVKNRNGTQVVTFQLLSQDGSAVVIKHEYIVKPANYMIDFNVHLNGADKLLTQNAMNIIWQSRALQLEKDMGYEKMQTQIGYLTNGSFNYHTIANRDNREFDKTTQWVAVKQQFFSRVFIAKNNFASGNIKWVVPDKSDTRTVVNATANLRVQVPAGRPPALIPFSLYYGPNDYKMLKEYNMQLENLVNMGQGIFAFVKYINRWIVLNVFDFFKSHIGSFGIVILLMTVVIRLVISPLTYSSYLSGAKMKALRPEIAKLKAKFGSDQQAISMEQMKLFREAGVNPLGGCIPALLQIPIFIALFSFFNSCIALRGQSFLWATDLSAYDSILTFGFEIPFYGNHISLFTILTVITSFLISIYSMHMMPNQDNPVLKYMPYIFPFFMLFFFNMMPSALTWYYTVSNVITLILQFVIQNYIIDHDKILAKIELNRKKPKTKSKWQERLEQVQQNQKKMKETQRKK